MELCPYCNSNMPMGTATCRVCGMSLTDLDIALKGGTSLGGRYSIGRVLGQGGFGITYLGADKLLTRPVAIKELVPDGSTRKGTQLVPPSSLRPTWRELCTRFLEEAQTLARFNHPSIVQVFDAIEENGTVYLVMERLEGRTLGEEIDSLGALEPKFVESLGLKICEALNIVHQAGLLHRDLKPDNVFLTKDARIVLIDFGSAREFRDSKTVRYTRMVTPGYAPLEQYAEAAILGPYTDIYGLGATLFHAITGKPPPSATDRVLGSQLQLSAVISKTVRNAIEQAMQVKVTDRPSSVEAMVRLLIGQIPAAPLPIMKSISSWAFLKSELIKPLQLHLTNLSIQDRKEQLRILQSNISLRLDVAESLQTDSQTLATLAHDKRSDRVRILVSKNLNTSISTLQFLLKDENPIVAQFAKANLVLRN